VCCGVRGVWFLVEGNSEAVGFDISGAVVFRLLDGSFFVGAIVRRGTSTAGPIAGDVSLNVDITVDTGPRPMEIPFNSLIAPDRRIALINVRAGNFGVPVIGGLELTDLAPMALATIPVPPAFPLFAAALGSFLFVRQRRATVLSNKASE